MYIIVEQGWEYDDNYYFKGGEVAGAIGPFRTKLEADIAAAALTVQLAASGDKGTFGFLSDFPDGESNYIDDLKKRIPDMREARQYDQRLPEAEWELFASQCWFHFYRVIELQEGNY